MSNSPIALFVYNRPHHTRHTVEALQRNEKSKDSDLFIFSDAARSAHSIPQVSAVRDYIATVTGFKSVRIIEREKNLGLANSVINGVTQLCRDYGKVIVLEDDLVVAPEFLEYMNLALEKYKDESKVMQISGYLFPVQLDIKDDALFLPLTTSWGWATWARAWNLFDPDAKGYKQLKADKALRNRFNLDGAYDYFSMLEAQLAGKIDSWAIRWYLSAFILKALTLYPRVSLLTNNGFDGSGTHCSTQEIFASSGSADGFVSSCFPEIVEVSPAWLTVQSSLKRRSTLFDRAKAKFMALLLAYK